MTSVAQTFEISYCLVQIAETLYKLLQSSQFFQTSDDKQTMALPVSPFLKEQLEQADVFRSPSRSHKRTRC